MDCPTPKKRKFGDMAAAEMYRDRIAKSGQRATTTEIYRCKCGNYHLASVDSQRSRRRKARDKEKAR